MAPSINFRCWALIWPGSRVTGFAPAARWSSWTAACDHRPFQRRAPTHAGPAQEPC
jgi:hypothetical protein